MRCSIAKQGNTLEGSYLYNVLLAWALPGRTIEAIREKAVGVGDSFEVGHARGCPDLQTLLWCDVSEQASGLSAIARCRGG